MKFLAKTLFIIVLLVPLRYLRAENYNEVFYNNEFNITSLMNAVYQDDEKATNVFLKSGADANETNSAGVSPLHMAAKNNSVNAMKVLIKYGANLNARDFEKWTPLMRACLNKNSEVVEILVKNGANMWLKNSFGESAVMHSVMSNCVDCLIIIAANTKNYDYDASDVVNEINKSLNIAYKKENTEMEEILNDFYNDITDGIGENDNGKSGKKKYNSKDKSKVKKTKDIKKNKDAKENKNDVKIKQEIEYITKKIYIFQGEVRRENSMKGNR